MTRRRALLVEFLRRERYLTRGGLRWRVEALLGKGCFGERAWEDTFYRDMRVVKAAFRAAGYELRYRSKKGRQWYYLKGEPAMLAEIATAIRSAAADLDPQQLSIFSRMTPARRFRLGFSVSNAAHRARLWRWSLREQGEA